MTDIRKRFGHEAAISLENLLEPPIVLAKYCDSICRLMARSYCKWDIPTPHSCTYSVLSQHFSMLLMKRSTKSKQIFTTQVLCFIIKKCLFRKSHPKFVAWNPSLRPMHQMDPCQTDYCCSAALLVLYYCSLQVVVSG